MELTNEFDVSAPIDRTWATLTDVEAIAPCLPGAQLQEIDGDEFKGIVKVKVGPITANYKGAATFVEKDDTAHKAVLRAEGRDARNGNAQAMITAQLVSLGDSLTKVQVSTDLHVTGKVAQFGRGVMADVSAKLMGQFADNLHTLIASGENGSAGASGESAGTGSASSSGHATTAEAATAAVATAAAPTDDAPPATSNGASPSATASTRRIINMPEPEPVDLLDAAGAPVLKRLAPVLGILVLLLILRRLFGGRS